MTEWLVPDVVATRATVCPTCAAAPDKPCIGWPAGSVHPSRCEMVAAPEEGVSLRGRPPAHLGSELGNVQPTRHVKGDR